MSVGIGTKRVCRNCGRVVMAVKDPSVVSLTAGVWVHTTLMGRLRCARAASAAEVVDGTGEAP